MRVISGIYGGRKLKSPKDMRVRPTTDRVKEAMFSMTQAMMDGAVCLDLFAGSGGLGIEALSRGASRVVFCDISKESCALVRENLRAVGAFDESESAAGEIEILCLDWRKAISRAHVTGDVFDIVFVDAPYDMCEYYADILSELKGARVLSEGAWVVIERDVGAGGYAKDDWSIGNGLRRVRERGYGQTSVDVWEVRGNR